MKRWLFFILLMVVQQSILLAAPLGRKLSLRCVDVPAHSLLDKISAETGIRFSYDAQSLNLNRNVTVTVENTTVEEVLQQAFKGEVCCKSVGKFVVLTPCKPHEKLEDTKKQAEAKRLLANEALLVHSPTLHIVEELPLQVALEKPKPHISTPIYSDEEQEATSAPTPIHTKDESADKAIKPIQLSFVYPIGTSGRKSSLHTYNVSLNILGGYVGGVSTVELGGVLNINSQTTSGFQAAGVANIIEEGNRLTQLAGIVNVAQAGELWLQAAGIANVGNSTAQLAGVVNVNKEHTKAQAAGVVNVASSSKLQLAPINIMRKGGVQVGVFNLRDSIDGPMIGFINIAKKGGILDVELAGGDFIHTSVGIRTGVPFLYGIWAYGICFPSEETTKTYGLGTTYFSKKRWQLGLELCYSSIEPTDKLKAESKAIRGKDSKELQPSMLFQQQMPVSYCLSPSFTLFVAPSLNVYVFDNDQLSRAKPIYSATINSSAKSVACWVGVRAGLRFNLHQYIFK